MIHAVLSFVRLTDWDTEAQILKLQLFTTEEKVSYKTDKSFILFVYGNQVIPLFSPSFTLSVSTAVQTILFKTCLMMLCSGKF